MIYKPHLIFWEVTRICNLGCPHCRASALKILENNNSSPWQQPGDITLSEAHKLINEITSFSNPILVLSGGEPLVRKDIFDIASYGTSKNLRVVLASNATLITEEISGKLKNSGIKRVSVSIYGTEAKLHEGFVGQEGIFEKTLRGIDNIKKAGISLQINTTITKKNLNQIKQLIKFSLDVKADALHVFFLVPTGRGKSIEGDEISAEEYEETFEQLFEMSSGAPLHIKATCAPHYYRVRKQLSMDDSSKPGEKEGFSAFTKGCLAGTGVCFISHEGKVFPCGYFQVAAGDVRNKHFRDIWENSPLFVELRDGAKLKGKCGVCEFAGVCGGCRARAYARTGDYLGEEPYCIYKPARFIDGQN